jgi:2-polyprenyl-6-methoxyphenol hydroxylase-like FAD-dependent oxidoreductase
MFGNVKTEVLVVGAGPVGLLAALQLADEGIDVEVIDEQWRPAGHSYALALHASSLRLLERVGLADELLARGLKLSTMTLFEDDEPRTALRLGLPDTPYPFVLAIPRASSRGSSWRGWSGRACAFVGTTGWRA